MKRKNVISLVLAVLLLIGLLTACNGAVDITLSFIVDGEVYHTIDTKGDGLITLPTNPTKEDYVFDGWFWEDGRPFTVNSLKDTPISEDLSVYAKWVTEASYTLTFVTSGGESVDAVSFHGGAAITQPTPTRDGYIFAGWYIDNGTFANKPNFNSMPANNLTVYAKWTANNADPYISINGGTVNGTDLYIEVESTATQLDLSAIISVASGASWELYKDITGSTKIPTKYASSLRNGNNIYYVVVTTNQGEVNRTYKLNIYRNHYVTMTFVSFDDIYTTEQVLTHTTMGKGPEILRTGYAFDGWGCNGHYVTKSKTFTAKWKANKYTATLIANGGSVGESSKIITMGSTFSFPTAYGKKGYSFDGWYTRASGGKKLTDNSGRSISNWSIAENTTVYAQWKINQYSVSLNKNVSEAGTVSGEGNKNYDSSVTITAQSNSGYTWLGWYEGVTKVSTGDSLSYTFNMPASNKIFEARWGDYNITLEKNIDEAGTISGAGKYVGATERTITATTNPGYTWLGWYDGEEKVSTGDSLSYTFNMPASNKTFEARWIANQGTISFNANGGEGSMNSVSITTGDSLPANTFTKCNYDFAGWSLTSEGDIVYSNQVPFVVIEDGASYTLYAKWSPYVRLGNYIWFGEYPQTIKANDVTITETTDSRGYYLGSDGYYYAKVTATPYSSDYKFSTNATVSSGTAYYFKVELIKWRILEESEGIALILCESIIANKRYNEDYTGTKNGVYANNYMNSEIRAWLNDEFYNTAFTALQQELIQITNVDNSVYSTGYSSNSYVCANTNDKIFLPSYRDMVNTAFGFSSSSSEYDTARRRLTSDYSRATGAYMTTYTSYYGNGWWWLRSPDFYNSNYARIIGSGGDAGSNNYVSDTYSGVVPALKIRL